MLQLQISPVLEDPRMCLFSHFWEKQAMDLHMCLPALFSVQINGYIGPILPLLGNFRDHKKGKEKHMRGSSRTGLISLRTVRSLAVSFSGAKNHAKRDFPDLFSPLRASLRSRKVNSWTTDRPQG